MPNNIGYTDYKGKTKIMPPATPEKKGMKPKTDGVKQVPLTKANGTPQAIGR